MDNQLQIVESSLTPQEVKSQVQLLQKIMEEVMQEGTHYGVIPGAGDKPSLWKAGAEKINYTFKLAPHYEELSVVETDGLISYRIKCILIHYPTGNIIATGLGACNSKEKKYYTRKVYESKASEHEKHNALFEDELIARNGGKYKVLTIINNPWDIQNTLYKMACKRALIAAVLNGTAASDIFTQDLEEDDVTTEIVKQQQEQAKPQPKPVNEPQKTQEENNEELSDLTHCTYGKNQGKLWKELPLKTLKWYQSDYTTKLSNNDLSKYYQQYRDCLSGIEEALELLGEKF